MKKLMTSRLKDRISVQEEGQAELVVLIIVIVLVIFFIVHFWGWGPIDGFFNYVLKRLFYSLRV